MAPPTSNVVAPPPAAHRVSPPPPPPPQTSGSDDSRETDLKHHGSADYDDDDGSEDARDGRRSTTTRFLVEPAGELGNDETTVDVVTVPCPGGHATRSWSRDGLMGRYFGAPSMREAAGESAATTAPSWVRQGIRREAPRARVLLYEHPPLTAQTTLAGLADALLAELRTLRGPAGAARPIVFVAHSVGGLVVKMAMTKASRDAVDQAVLRECYGVAFFATPHQGSSYLAMPSLAPSIQSLLRLASPLPGPVTEALRVGNGLLQRVDEDFKAVSTDVRVWTFYETIESRLSGAAGDVYLTAPLTSIKSAVLGMRQETIFALQSDHANIASFGRHNAHSLRVFLRQLALQIARADMTLRDADGHGRWTLGLEQKVNVEVHGFYDDAADAHAHGAVATIRAWSTRLPLHDFLAKGPDVCLRERLSEVEGAPEQGRFLHARGGSSLVGAAESPPTMPVTVSPTMPLTVGNVLGIRDRQAASRHIVTPGSPLLRPVDAVDAVAAVAAAASHDQRSRSDPAVAPRGLATPPSDALLVAPVAPGGPPVRPPSLIQADLEQDLAIDRLSPPLRPRVGRSISRSFSLGSDRRRLEYREFVALSPRSRSAVMDPTGGQPEDADDDDVDDDDIVEPSTRLPEAVLAIRKVAAKVGRIRGHQDEAPVATFARPRVRTRRFVWVHVPFNNPTWVKSVLQTLEASYETDLSTLYGHDFWATRHTRGRHSQHYAYFAKPGCYFTSSRPLSPRPSITGPSLSPKTLADSAMYTVLFLPYLHFDSYKRLIRRRNLILQRLGFGRSRPVPEAVAKTDLLELQVVWEFLGHDPPINCRRTLDQFAYPSLRDTRARDDDQMLYKLTKERGCGAESESGRAGVHSQTSAGTGSDKGGGSASSTTSGSWRERLMGKAGSVATAGDVHEAETVRNGNVLMVDQLWLWVIDSHTLTSFFPKRDSDPVEGPLFQQADLRDSIFNDVNVDLSRQCQNALDLAALAALHAVSVLLDRSSHPDLEVLRIFEEAISALTERLTWSLKVFRTEGFRDKAFDYDQIENKARSIRARHKEEGLRAERENRDNTSALLELRDIEDELLTLVHLFERQTKVLSSMLATYQRPEVRDQTANGRVFLAEALKRLRDYAQQADEMVRRVRGTRDDYDKLLQMVQRQAQVDEVRLSRLHADLASAQSRSVTIFTTFTVIFLPMTFFTGLFGMNTHEWGGGGNLPLRTIGLVALPSSLVLVVAALFIAFSTAARKMLRGARAAYGRMARGLLDACGEAMSRATRRRRGDAGADDDEEARGGGGGRRRRRGPEREVSDFWERHRMERERGYRIPDANRVKTAPGWVLGGAGGAGGTFGLRMGATGTRMRRG